LTSTYKRTRVSVSGYSFFVSIPIKIILNIYHFIFFFIILLNNFKNENSFSLFVRMLSAFALLS